MRPNYATTGDYGAASVPQRILLIQGHAAAAKTIVDALNHCKDQSFQVEWVERCSEGLNRLDSIEALLLDLYLSDRMA